MPERHTIVKQYDNCDKTELVLKSWTIKKMALDCYLKRLKIVDIC